MAKPKNDSEETPLTEQVSAPETIAVAPPVYQARNMRVERQGSQSEPFVHHYPDIRGGTCEWCGVLDRNVPAQYQYKLCPHYRGMDARCTYCPQHKNSEEVVLNSAMKVLEHPDKPGTLIMMCNSYDCARAHEQRFRRNS